MRCVVTGEIRQYLDDSRCVLLNSRRKTRQDEETLAWRLTFIKDETYEEFKAMYVSGDSCAVYGILNQGRVLLRDEANQQVLKGPQGHDLTLTHLEVDVRGHLPMVQGEQDWCFAHGLVTLVEDPILKQSQGGLAYTRLKVAYNRAAGRTRGDGADFYQTVAFGAQAERLSSLRKGDRIVLDHALPSLQRYEMRDLLHSNGAPVIRHVPELLVREFGVVSRLASGERTRGDAA
jgi:hypothetical protein